VLHHLWEFCSYEPAIVIKMIAIVSDPSRGIVLLLAAKVVDEPVVEDVVLVEVVLVEDVTVEFPVVCANTIACSTQRTKHEMSVE